MTNNERLRKVIAAEISADPERSNSAIAREIGCSHHTVQRVRVSRQVQARQMPAHPLAAPPQGNTRALTHGGDSERMIAARADEIRGELFKVAPDLEEPRFAGIVDEYIRAVARAHLLDDWIRATCETKGPAAVSSRSWEQATSAARLASRLSSQLALDPISAASLKHTAVDVESALRRLQDHVGYQAKESQ